MQSLSKKVPSQTSLRRKREKTDLLRLRSDEEYANMNTQQLKARLKSLHEQTTAMTHDELCKQPKTRERSRHWLIWHDHSNIAGAGLCCSFLEKSMILLYILLTRSKGKRVMEKPYMFSLL